MSVCVDIVGGRVRGGGVYVCLSMVKLKALYEIYTARGKFSKDSTTFICLLSHGVRVCLGLLIEYFNSLLCRHSFTMCEMKC